MRLFSHLTLLLVSIFILIWGIVMLNSKGGGVIVFIGLITSIYAVMNIGVLFLSLKVRENNRKKLVLISGVINGILFIAWLVSSIYFGGLQQLEAPAVCLLGLIGVSNYFTVRQNYNEKIEKCTKQAFKWTA